MTLSSSRVKCVINSDSSTNGILHVSQAMSIGSFCSCRHLGHILPISLRFPSLYYAVKETKPLWTQLKPFFQLPPLLLRRTAEALRKMNGRLQCFLARPRILRGRRQIFKKLADEFRAHALIEQREHLDRVPDAPGERRDLFADADFTRRFHVVAADLHMPRIAGFGRQRSAPVKPHRPKPLVDADALGRVHEPEVKPVLPRCNFTS